MKKYLFVLAVLLTTVTAFAKEPAVRENSGKEPSPEEMKQLMEASFGAMVPMMGKMTEVMVDVQLKIAEKPETAKSLAIFKRNLYNELLAQGFSKKDAFSIMLNTSMPAAMPGIK